MALETSTCPSTGGLEVLGQIYHHLLVALRGHFGSLLRLGRNQGQVLLIRHTSTTLAELLCSLHLPNPLSSRIRRQYLLHGPYLEEISLIGRSHSYHYATCGSLQATFPSPF